jgi:hypothetical protein
VARKRKAWAEKSPVSEGRTKAFVENEELKLRRPARRGLPNLPEDAVLSSGRADLEVCGTCLPRDLNGEILRALLG